MHLVESETPIFPNRPWYLGSGLVRKVAAPTSDPVRSGNVLEPSDHELRTYGQLDHLSGASPGEWGGKVPDVAVGKIRNPWMVILLSIITLGIYALYWQYASFKEMKEHAGEGIGGGLGCFSPFFSASSMCSCFHLRSATCTPKKVENVRSQVSPGSGYCCPSLAESSG